MEVENSTGTPLVGRPIQPWPLASEWRVRQRVIQLTPSAHILYQGYCHDLAFDYLRYCRNVTPTILCFLIWLVLQDDPTEGRYSPDNLTKILPTKLHNTRRIPMHTGSVN